MVLMLHSCAFIFCPPSSASGGSGDGMSARLTRGSAQNFVTPPDPCWAAVSARSFPSIVACPGRQNSQTGHRRAVDILNSIARAGAQPHRHTHQKLLVHPEARLIALRVSTKRQTGRFQSLDGRSSSAHSAASISPSTSA